MHMRSSFKDGPALEKSVSINRLASSLLEELLTNCAYFGVKTRKTDCGTTLIDAGVGAHGGFEAGRLITEICMGGCGKARITHKKYGDLELPSIFVYTDHPVIATLGSQYAGWQINEEGYFGIGSGPARALAQRPKEIYEEIGYKDDYDKSVLVLEADKPPPSKLIEKISKDCRIDSKDLTVIMTPTASVAGATQVSGRIVETGIHKLRRIGLDPKVILHAWGCAPIPPIHPKFSNAMARTNDAILYGGTAHYTVRYDDDHRLMEILEKAPSRASNQYGKRFIEIFKEAENDFYKIDPNLFAPATITINNVKTGNTFKSGDVNSEALGKSLGLS
jgi:methenyltetrahydromethanopterin cyclohydrolase